MGPLALCLKGSSCLSVNTKALTSNNVTKDVNTSKAPLTDRRLFSGVTAEKTGCRHCREEVSAADGIITLLDYFPSSQWRQTFDLSCVKLANGATFCQF